MTKKVPADGLIPPPGKLLEKVRWMFLLISFATAVFVVPLILTAAESPWSRPRAVAEGVETPICC